MQGLNISQTSVGSLRLHVLDSAVGLGDTKRDRDGCRGSASGVQGSSWGVRKEGPLQVGGGPGRWALKGSRGAWPRMAPVDGGQHEERLEAGGWEGRGGPSPEAAGEEARVGGPRFGDGTAQTAGAAQRGRCCTHGRGLRVDAALSGVEAGGQAAAARTGSGRELGRLQQAAFRLRGEQSKLQRTPGLEAPGNVKLGPEVTTEDWQTLTHHQDAWGATGWGQGCGGSFQHKLS